MANSDKDILITPNTGQSNDPKIEFSGATVGSSSTITMSAKSKADGQGVLNIESSSSTSIAAFSETNTGTLFSITNDNGQSKFEVNETGVVNTSLNSGALGVPVGTTSERPVGSETGFIRWNSTISSLEVYTGSSWVSVISEYFPSGSTHFGGD